MERPRPLWTLKTRQNRLVAGSPLWTSLAQLTALHRPLWEGCWLPLPKNQPSLGPVGLGLCLFGAEVSFLSVDRKILATAVNVTAVKLKTDNRLTVAAAIESTARRELVKTATSTIGSWWWWRWWWWWWCVFLLTKTKTKTTMKIKR